MNRTGPVGEKKRAPQAKKRPHKLNSALNSPHSSIYAVDNLEAARAAQARSQASLNAVREEDLRKQRIAIQIVRDVLDETFQYFQRVPARLRRVRAP